MPVAFAPVVDDAHARITEMFDATRLHSAYLYGSIPRGTAVPGVSDLDLLLTLRDEPTDADHVGAGTIEAAIDRSFPQVNGVGILLSSARTLLSERELHDGGFFIACLCTPLLGGDLAEQLPRCRPTSVLARETNGDLARALPRRRARAAEAATEADRKALSRIVGRKIVRSGFTLVMPRWGGWTSDLGESAELFGRYYPERREQMRLASATGRTPSADPMVLSLLVDDLGP
ncbi:nucleotidyltransferase domain-containing protein [Streptomyces sp. NPDC002867]